MFLNYSMHLRIYIECNVHLRMYIKYNVNLRVYENNITLFYSLLIMLVHVACIWMVLLVGQVNNLICTIVCHKLIIWNNFVGKHTRFQTIFGLKIKHEKESKCSCVLYLFSIYLCQMWVKKHMVVIFIFESIWDNSLKPIQVRRKILIYIKKTISTFTIRALAYNVLLSGTFDNLGRHCGTS